MGSIKDDKPILLVSMGSGTRIQDFAALVDTGFTGELKMPPGVARDLGIVTTDVRDVLMGDGSRASHGNGRAIVSLEGVKKQVSVLVGNGPVIIGVRLLRDFGYTLTVDFPNDRFTLHKEGDLFDAEE